MTKQRIASILQAAGGVSATVAGFLVAPVAGFAVLGLGLIVFGVAVEREAVTTDAEQPAPVTSN